MSIKYGSYSLSLYRKKVFLPVAAIILSVAGNTQPCAPFVFPNLFGQAETAIFCKNNSVGFGVSNSIRPQTYTFDQYANNGQLMSRKGGPLDGNGGQLSVAAFMRSAKDVGEYRITVANACGESATVNFYAYYGNIDNLSIRGWGSNDVWFQWAACGPTSDVRYEYAVTTQPNPNAVLFSDYIVTTDTSGYGTALIPGQTYYIHVRVREVWRNGNSSNPVGLYNYPSPNACSDLPYQTLRFTSCSGSPPTGGITPATAITCTADEATLNASGGTSYQWYNENNTAIPGATNPTYDASLPGQYRVYVTTAAGCAGIVYSATVIDTLFRNSILSGGGAFCDGDTVRLALSETKPGLVYTLMKDGVDITTLQGIGNANEEGSPDTVWYKFKLTSAAQTGVYSVRSFDPYCGNLYFGYSEVSFFSGSVTGLNAIYIGEDLVGFNWDQQGSGPSSYEWAFTSDPSPPASAWGVINYQPVYYSPFVPGTQYYFHLRPACLQQPSPFSWSTTGFITANCSNAQPVTLNTTINAAIPTGEGSWNFTGTYPVNSTGYATPGKEVMYKFTPSETAVYYIDITSASNAEWVDYFYKPLDHGCSNTGWTAIDDMNGVGKCAIGLLTAGTTYLILLDSESPSGSVTHSFQIRKATVGAVNPGICTSSTWLSLPIPANSPKEEYLIDDNGNLIASLDFSSVTNPVGLITASYYRNDAVIRRDIGNREYLDRNFTILTSTAPLTPVGVKLFFTNTELQRLINEPDDGIADVVSLSGLNVTRVQQNCSEGLYQGVSSLLPQVSNGPYDATSSYIKFNNTYGFSTFYIHGGLVPLETNNNIICPAAGSASFTVTSPGAGYTHQWQVDNGTGFQNLSDNSIYSGVTSATLTLTNPPTSLNGNKYRCVSTNGSNTVTSGGRTLKFIINWTGGSNSQWQNPANWSCGVVPDADTDVIIDSYFHAPVISSNVSCKSVQIKPGASLTVNPGFKLTITGK
ncbi:MAG: hypothetical protein JNK14_00165 [Chitinophagaceae bacterium]|nr:hypothetical protein [Chitinophagaceae bacterium]